MNSRRLMQICPSRTKPTKRRVLRHSKIGPLMALCLILVGSRRSRRSRHVGFPPIAPKNCGAIKASLDCKVCAKERQGWNREPECARGFEVDDERKACGLLDRDIAWPCTFENLIDERRHLAKSTAQARPIRDQPTLIRRFWPLIYRG